MYVFFNLTDPVNLSASEIKLILPITLVLNKNLTKFSLIHASNKDTYIFSES